jgi:hypothetical protein
MIVPKEKPVLAVTISPEQQEKNYWDKLKFDSHKFIEHHEGYHQCDFCKIWITSMMPLDVAGYSICKENPHLR